MRRLTASEFPFIDAIQKILILPVCLRRFFENCVSNGASESKTVDADRKWRRLGGGSANSLSSRIRTGVEVVVASPADGLK